MKAILALALTAGTACAQSAFTAVHLPEYKLDSAGTPSNEPAPQIVLGDTVNWAITAFSTAGGAFLHAPQTHTVGQTNASAGGGPVGAVTISSSVSTVGLIRTLTLDIVTVSNARLMLSGQTIGGAVIDTVRFEIPGVNGGTNFFTDPYKVSNAVGTFTLLGNGGAAIFSSAATMTNSGTSFGMSNGITTGAGTNLFSNYITGAHYEISYTVPTPASAALLGLGGLVATRRRR